MAYQVVYNPAQHAYEVKDLSNIIRPGQPEADALIVLQRQGLVLVGAPESDWQKADARRMAIGSNFQMFGLGYELSAPTANKVLTLQNLYKEVTRAVDQVGRTDNLAESDVSMRSAFDPARIPDDLVESDVTPQRFEDVVSRMRDADLGDSRLTKHHLLGESTAAAFKKDGFDVDLFVKETYRKYVAAHLGGRQGQAFDGPLADRINATVEKLLAATPYDGRTNHQDHIAEVSHRLANQVGHLLQSAGLDFAPEGTRALVGEAPKFHEFTPPLPEPNATTVHHAPAFEQNQQLFEELSTPRTSQKPFPDTRRYNVALRAERGNSTGFKGVRAHYELAPDVNEIGRQSGHVRGIYDDLSKGRDTYGNADAAGYVGAQQLGDQRRLWEEASGRKVGQTVSLLTTVDRRSSSERSLRGIRGTRELDRMETGFVSVLHQAAADFVSRKGSKQNQEALEVMVATDDIRDVMLGQAALRIRDAGGIRISTADGDVVVPVVVTTVGGAKEAKRRLTDQLWRVDEHEKDTSLKLSNAEKKAIAQELKYRSDDLRARSNIHNQVSASGMSRGYNSNTVHAAQSLAHQAIIRNSTESNANHIVIGIDDDIGADRRARLEGLLEVRGLAAPTPAKNAIVDDVGRKGNTRMQLVGSMSQLAVHAEALPDYKSPKHASRGAAAAAQVRHRAANGMRTGRARAGHAGANQVRVTARQSERLVKSEPFRMPSTGSARVANRRAQQQAEEAQAQTTAMRRTDSHARRLDLAPGALPDASAHHPARQAKRRTAADANETLTDVHAIEVAKNAMHVPRATTGTALDNVEAQLTPYSKREAATITGPANSLVPTLPSPTRDPLRGAQQDRAEALGDALNPDAPTRARQRAKVKWGKLHNGVSQRIIERAHRSVGVKQRQALGAHLEAAADDASRLGALPAVTSRRDALHLANALRAKGLAISVADYSQAEFGHMPKQDEYRKGLQADNAAYALRKNADGSAEYISLARMPIKEREALRAANPVGKTMLHEQDPLQISLASTVFRKDKNGNYEFRTRNEALDNNQKLLVGVDKDKVGEEGFHNLSTWSRNKAESILRARVAANPTLAALDQAGYARTKLEESLGAKRGRNQLIYMKTSQSRAVKDALAGEIAASLEEALAYEQSLRKGKNFRDFTTLAKGLLSREGRTDRAFEVAERVRGIGDAAKNPGSIYAELHSRMQASGHKSAYQAALHLAEMEQAGLFELRHEYEEVNLDQGPKLNRKSGIVVKDARFLARTASMGQVHNLRNTALVNARKAAATRHSLFDKMAHRFRSKNFAFAPLALAGQLDGEGEESGGMFENITALDVVGALGVVGLAGGLVSGIRRGRMEAKREQVWKGKEAAAKEILGAERDKARAYFEYGQQLFRQGQTGQAPESIADLTEKQRQQRLQRQAIKGKGNYNAYSTLERIGVNITASTAGGLVTSGIGRAATTIGLQTAFFDSYTLNGLSSQDLKANTATYLLNQMAATGFTPGYYQKMDQSAQAQREASIRTSAGLIGLAAGATAAGMVEFGSATLGRGLYYAGWAADRLGGATPLVPGTTQLNNAGQGATGRAGRAAQNAAAAAAAPGSPMNLPSAAGRQLNRAGDLVSGGVSRAVGAGAANVAGAAAFIGIGLLATGAAITLLDSYGFQELKSQSVSRGMATDQVDLAQAVGDEAKYGEGDAALQNAEEISFEDEAGNPLEVEFDGASTLIGLVSGMDGEELRLDDLVI